MKNKIILIMFLLFSINIYAEPKIKLKEKNSLAKTFITMFKDNRENNQYLDSLVVDDENYYYLIGVLNKSDSFKNTNSTRLELNIIQKAEILSSDIGAIILSLSKSDNYISFGISINSIEWFFLNEKNTIEFKIDNQFIPLSIKTHSQQYGSSLATYGATTTTVLSEGNFSKLIETIMKSDIPAPTLARISLSKKANLDITIPKEFFEMAKKYILNQ